MKRKKRKDILKKLVSKNFKKKIYCTYITLLYYDFLVENGYKVR
jgi:hypothetical protein